jgi:8-oxo-dGTP pyrophosphatase MutT (NUDIX family)
VKVDDAAPRRYPEEVVVFDLETIRRQLHGRRARRPPSTGEEPVGEQRQAAVAAILRTAVGTDGVRDETDTEVLLIRRAERPGDPWSGHMAFPGGHYEPHDADLRATAIRETMEEVGLDLRAHDYLGPLDEIVATARGRLVGMTIAPHVFALRDVPLELRPNYEVAELVWGKLGPMMRGEIDDIKELRYDGEPRRMPAFRVQDNLVWGMTHNMLRSLFRVIESAA